MASTNTPPPPPAAAAAQPSGEKKTYESPLLHNLALGMTPLAMLALALPPRRFDFRAIALGGTAMWGVFQLKYDYTGQSTMHRLMSPSDPSSSSSSSLMGGDLPPAALETQRRIREEKARRQHIRDLDARLREQGVADEAERKHRILAELEAQRRRGEPIPASTTGSGAGGKDPANRGRLEALWMGDAGADWKEQRAAKEREALTEGGGGIWGLIADQFSDVFSVFSPGDKKAQDERAGQGKGGSGNEGGKSEGSSS